VFKVLLTGVILLFGCDRTPVRNSITTLPGNPTMFLLQVGHYPGPNESASGGLVFVAWHDGTFIRSKSAESIGTTYVRGRLTPQRLSELTRAVERTLGNPAMRSYVIMESEQYELSRRTPAGVTTYAQSAGSGVLFPSQELQALMDMAFAVAVDDAREMPEVPVVQTAWYRP
jgi:hypothetical protein